MLRRRVVFLSRGVNLNQSNWLPTTAQGRTILTTLDNPTRSKGRRCTLQVLAVGDCNTWGLHDPPIGNTILDKFCRQLEHEGYVVSSQNLGYGMATTREGVELVRRVAKPADVALINFGLVDTWITSIPRIYIPYYPNNFVRKRLRKLLKFVKRRLRAPRLRRLISVGPVVPIDEYTQNVREMIAHVRVQNPRATILLWGSPPVQHDPARNANLDRYNRRLELIANDTNSLYVATSTVVTQLPNDVAYLDDVHLNETATEAIAQQMAIIYRARQLPAAG